MSEEKEELKIKIAKDLAKALGLTNKQFNEWINKWREFYQTMKSSKISDEIHIALLDKVFKYLGEHGTDGMVDFWAQLYVDEVGLSKEEALHTAKEQYQYLVLMFTEIGYMADVKEKSSKYIA